MWIVIDVSSAVYRNVSVWECHVMQVSVIFWVSIWSSVGHPLWPISLPFKNNKKKPVKFGRMSKKQREKVEDEVRYHRAQLTTTNGLSNSNQISLVNGQLTCAQLPGQTIINSNNTSSISMSPVSIYLQPNNSNNVISTNNNSNNSNGFDMITSINSNTTNSNQASSNHPNSSLNSRTSANSTTNGILITNGNSNQMIITQQPNSSTPTPTSNQIADPSPDSSVFEPQQPSSSNLSITYNGGWVLLTE